MAPIQAVGILFVNLITLIAIKNKTYPIENHLLNPQNYITSHNVHYVNLKCIYAIISTFLNCNFSCSLIYPPLIGLNFPLFNSTKFRLFTFLEILCVISDH